jgi:hypothetical protein
MGVLHLSQEPPVGCVRRSRNARLSFNSVGYAAANPPYKLLIENGARSEDQRCEFTQVALLTINVFCHCYLGLSVVSMLPVA